MRAPPVLFRISPILSHYTIPRSAAKYRPLQAVLTRTMTSSPPKQQPPMPPRFSDGSDVAAAGKALSALLVSSDGRGGGGRWNLTADGEGVERTFRFKTFAKTWVCPDVRPYFCAPACHHHHLLLCCLSFGVRRGWGVGGTASCEMASQ